MYLKAHNFFEQNHVLGKEGNMQLIIVIFKYTS